MWLWCSSGEHKYSKLPCTQPNTVCDIRPIGRKKREKKDKEEIGGARTGKEEGE